MVESLDDEVNDLLEYCKDKNIEIVYDNADYENKDDNNDDKTNKNKEKPKNVK
ncbi:hypothetical protein [Candidatus Phytoplasma solani]|uniref:hypothetical protein n=1 Tax=Candidatus Phytoplasma solani TaxID=69896 RepID=UPI00358E1915